MATLNVLLFCSYKYKWCLFFRKRQMSPKFMWRICMFM